MASKAAAQSNFHPATFVGAQFCSSGANRGYIGYSAPTDWTTTLGHGVFERCVGSQGVVSPHFKTRGFMASFFILRLQEYGNASLFPLHFPKVSKEAFTGLLGDGAVMDWKYPGDATLLSVDAPAT